MSDERLLIGLLALNALVTLGYGLACRYVWHKKMSEALLRCALMLLCPGAGAMCLLLAWVWRRVFFRRPVRLPSLAAEEAHDANPGGAEDIVPLREALAVSDRQSARRLMLEVVRRDAGQSLSGIAHALSSDDSELSHYAASVLQESLSQFHESTQARYARIQALEATLAAHDTPRHTVRAAGQNAPRGALGRSLKRELSEARALAASLDAMLSQKVLPANEAAQTAALLDKITGLIDRRGVPSPQELERAALLLLDVGDGPAARRWCERLAQRYPSVLAAYTCRLRYHYALSEREAFFAVMDELTRAGLPLDVGTRDMLRAFGREA